MTNDIKVFYIFPNTPKLHYCCTTFVVNLFHYHFRDIHDTVVKTVKSWRNLRRWGNAMFSTSLKTNKKPSSEILLRKPRRAFSWKLHFAFKPTMGAKKCFLVEYLQQVKKYYSILGISLLRKCLSSKVHLIFFNF